MKLNDTLKMGEMVIFKIYLPQKKSEKYFFDKINLTFHFFSSNLYVGGSNKRSDFFKKIQNVK